MFATPSRVNRAVKSPFLTRTPRTATKVPHFRTPRAPRTPRRSTVQTPSTASRRLFANPASTAKFTPTRSACRAGSNCATFTSSSVAKSRTRSGSTREVQPKAKVSGHGVAASPRARSTSRKPRPRMLIRPSPSPARCRDRSAKREVSSDDIFATVALLNSTRKSRRSQPQATPLADDTTSSSHSNFQPLAPGRTSAAVCTAPTTPKRSRAKASKLKPPGSTRTIRKRSPLEDKTNANPLPSGVFSTPIRSSARKARIATLVSARKNKEMDSADRKGCLRTMFATPSRVRRAVKSPFLTHTPRAAAKIPHFRTPRAPRTPRSTFQTPKTASRRLFTDAANTSNFTNCATPSSVAKSASRSSRKVESRAKDSTARKANVYATPRQRSTTRNMLVDPSPSPATHCHQRSSKREVTTDDIFAAVEMLNSAHKPRQPQPRLLPDSTASAISTSKPNFWPPTPSHTHAAAVPTTPKRLRTKVNHLKPPSSNHKIRKRSPLEDKTNASLSRAGVYSTPIRSTHKARNAMLMALSAKKNKEMDSADKKGLLIR